MCRKCDDLQVVVPVNLYFGIIVISIRSSIFHQNSMRLHAGSLVLSLIRRHQVCILNTLRLSPPSVSKSYISYQINIESYARFFFLTFRNDLQKKLGHCESNKLLEIRFCRRCNSFKNNKSIMI